MEGLKMPSLDDYKNCNFETEAERYEAYAYALKRYAESLEEYIDRIKSKDSENLEYIKQKVKEAYELSEKATDLNNKIYTLWFGDCTPIFENQSQIIISFHDQLQTLCNLNMLLINLITDFEYDFRLIKYRKLERKINHE